MCLTADLPLIHTSHLGAIRQSGRALLASRLSHYLLIHERKTQLAWIARKPAPAPFALAGLSPSSAGSLTLRYESFRKSAAGPSLLAKQETNAERHRSRALRGCYNGSRIPTNSDASEPR